MFEYFFVPDDGGRVRLCGGERAGGGFGAGQCDAAGGGCGRVAGYCGWAGFDWRIARVGDVCAAAWGWMDRGADALRRDGSGGGRKVGQAFCFSAMRYELRGLSNEE